MGARPTRPGSVVLNEDRTYQRDAGILGVWEMGGGGGGLDQFEAGGSANGVFVRGCGRAFYTCPGDLLEICGVTGRSVGGVAWWGGLGLSGGGYDSSTALPYDCCNFLQPLHQRLTEDR
ncbi:hypothetical protein Tco_0319340 [Tanacetum coccineum]